MASEFQESLLFRLPNELIRHLLGFLEIPDILRFVKTCRTAKIISIPALYKTIKIVNEEQLRNIQTTVKKRPDLTLHVKSLIVENELFSCDSFPDHEPCEYCDAGLHLALALPNLDYFSQATLLPYYFDCYLMEWIRPEKIFGHVTQFLRICALDSQDRLRIYSTLIIAAGELENTDRSIVPLSGDTLYVLFIPTLEELRICNFIIYLSENNTSPWVCKSFPTNNPPLKNLTLSQCEVRKDDLHGLLYGRGVKHLIFYSLEDLETDDLWFLDVISDSHRALEPIADSLEHLSVSNVDSDLREFQTTLTYLKALKGLDVHAEEFFLPSLFQTYEGDPIKGHIISQILPPSIEYIRFYAGDRPQKDRFLHTLLVLKGLIRFKEQNFPNLKQIYVSWVASKPWFPRSTLEQIKDVCQNAGLEVIEECD